MNESAYCDSRQITIFNSMSKCITQIQMKTLYATFTPVQFSTKADSRCTAHETKSSAKCIMTQ